MKNINLYPTPYDIERLQQYSRLAYEMKIKDLEEMKLMINSLKEEVLMKYGKYVFFVKQILIYIYICGGVVIWVQLLGFRGSVLMLFLFYVNVSGIWSRSRLTP